MYFKREIKSSKIGTKFIPALKYGTVFGFSRKIKNYFFLFWKVFFYEQETKKGSVGRSVWIVVSAARALMQFRGTEGTYRDRAAKPRCRPGGSGGGTAAVRK